MKSIWTIDISQFVETLIETHKQCILVGRRIRYGKSEPEYYFYQGYDHCLAGGEQVDSPYPAESDYSKLWLGGFSLAASN